MINIDEFKREREQCDNLYKAIRSLLLTEDVEKLQLVDIMIEKLRVKLISIIVNSNYHNSTQLQQ